MANASYVYGKIPAAVVKVTNEPINNDEIDVQPGREITVTATVVRDDPACPVYCPTIDGATTEIGRQTAQAAPSTLTFPVNLKPGHWRIDVVAEEYLDPRSTEFSVGIFQRTTLTAVEIWVTRVVRRSMVTITSKAPTKAQKLRKKVVVKGRVTDAQGKPQQGRAVQVEVKGLKKNGKTQWLPVYGAKASTNSKGIFTLKAPTHYWGTHVFRVRTAKKVTSETDEYTTAVSKAQKIIVKPDYSPQGRRKSYSFLMMADSGGREPATNRWNSCRTVPYYINAKYTSPAFRKAVKYAIGQATAATGMRFTYQGTIKRKPTKVPPFGIHFSYPGPQQVPALSGYTTGLGTPATDRNLSWDLSGTVPYRYGLVIVDRTDVARSADLRAATLHELGHALGLGHHNDYTQLMFPVLTGRTHFGNGDLAGLRRLGFDSGCDFSQS